MRGVKVSMRMNKLLCDFATKSSDLHLRGIKIDNNYSSGFSGVTQKTR